MSGTWRDPAHPDFVGWEIPGWDWRPGDYAWLSSESGIYENGTSIFFIHGGRVRHQAHMPHGTYTREELLAWFDQAAEGLDQPYLYWCDDTGGGYPGLWLEGTRPPKAEDITRLQAARERQERNDERTLQDIMQRRSVRDPA